MPYEILRSENEDVLNTQRELEREGNEFPGEVYGTPDAMYNMIRATKKGGLGSDNSHEFNVVLNSVGHLHNRFNRVVPSDQAAASLDARDLISDMQITIQRCDEYLGKHKRAYTLNGIKRRRKITSLKNTLETHIRTLIQVPQAAASPGWGSEPMSWNRFLITHGGQSMFTGERLTKTDLNMTKIHKLNAQSLGTPEFGESPLTPTHLNTINSWGLRETDGASGEFGRALASYYAPLHQQQEQLMTQLQNDNFDYRETMRGVAKLRNPGTRFIQVEFSPTVLRLADKYLGTLDNALDNPQFRQFFGQFYVAGMNSAKQRSSMPQELKDSNNTAGKMEYMENTTIAAIFNRGLFSTGNFGKFSVHLMNILTRLDVISRMALPDEFAPLMAHYRTVRTRMTDIGREAERARVAATIPGIMRGAPAEG